MADEMSAAGTVIITLFQKFGAMIGRTSGPSFSRYSDIGRSHVSRMPTFSKGFIAVMNSM